MGDFKRDRWGRPLINVEGKDVPYTRISSYGQILEDQSGLNRWKLRTVVAGIAQRPDLVSLAVANAGNDRKLDDLAQQFLDAGGASRAANTGTAIHEMLARVDSGVLDIAAVPDQFMPYAQAWQNCLRDFGFEVLPELVEIPLVNDRYQAAGSSDNFVLRTSDGLLVAVDKKTGKQISNRPLAYMVQLALYATSVEYNVETGERKALPPVDLSTAYIAHIPAIGDTCTLYEINLQEALALCDLAQAVRNAQKHSTPVVESKPKVTVSRDDLINRVAAIRDAGHVAHLAAIWPADTPTFKQSSTQTNSQLLAIRSAVEQIERQFELPFIDAPKPVEQKKPAKKKTVAKVTVDEGDAVDSATVAALRKHIKSLPEGQQKLIAAWAKEASQAGSSISLSANPSARRFEIARLMITLAAIDDPNTVLNQHVEITGTIGQTLAGMSIGDATTINNTIQENING